MRGAFESALSEEGCAGVVTVSDADGFTAGDVAAVADALIADSTRLYVGTRETPEKKSLPATLFGFLSGIDAADIETSLLGMSTETARLLLGMKGGDRAFLMNILLEARSRSIDISEVRTSAPRPAQPGWSLLTQSFKLYFVFIKFSISAMIAYLVDIGTFYVFEQVFASLRDEYKILVCTVLSRILCSIATYFLNKGAVFKSQAKQTGAVVRFVILAAAQLIASWLLVWSIGSLLGGGDVTNMLLKIVVDLVIFIASFTIQRDWVFKKTDGLLK